MNNSCEKDLLGFVLGALDAAEQKEIQQAMDCDPNLENDLIALKNAIAPLDYLDSGGQPPALARRTCELIASLLPSDSHPNPHSNPHPTTAMESLEPMQPLEGVQPWGMLQRRQHSVDWLHSDQTAGFFPKKAPVSTTASTPPLDPHPFDPQHSGNPSDLTPRREILSQSATPAIEPDRSATANQEGTPSVASCFAAHPNLSPAATSGRQLSADHRRHGSYRSPFSLVDLAFAAGVMLILSGILFPAIAYTRYHSRILHCQNNLRQIGDSLQAYSQINRNRFVEIPTSGPLSVVGSFAPILKESGLVEQDSLFACAGVAHRKNTPPVLIPSLQTVETAVGDHLLELQMSLSGHYGYSMGIATPDGSTSWKNLGRSFVVLVADSPALNRSNRISSNHQGRGQNCLFEDGRVEFIAGDSLGEDSLFFNDYHQVAPGCRPGDNVIAPSHLSPVFVSRPAIH